MRRMMRRRRVDNAEGGSAVRKPTSRGTIFAGCGDVGLSQTYRFQTFRLDSRSRLTWMRMI